MRPVWTRFSGPSITSSASDRFSTGWPTSPDQESILAHPSHLPRWRRMGRRAARTAGLARKTHPAAGRPNMQPRSSVSMTVGPETCYRVRGSAPLRGTVFVQGAKNAALKMIAASLLASEGRTVLRNIPPIEDVRRAIELAQAVGAVVKFHEAERTLVVDASQL